MKILDTKGTAAKIKSMMTIKGVYGTTVARQLGISVVAVSRWRTGESLPTLDNLVMLSSICQCTIDELIATQEI